MRQGLFLCLAVGLAAQEPRLDDLQDLQKLLDQPVAAASKRIQRLKEAPADMTVLTSADLAIQGYRTLGEALEGVLGFRVNRDRAYEGLGVRGLYVLGDQNTRVLIMVDGHPLNSPAEVGSGKLGEDFGIPLDLVERIEIIRGPASSLYGNNAFLGMVNVVVKQPEAAAGIKGRVLVTGNSRGLGALDGLLGGFLGGAKWQAICSGMQRKGSETSFPALVPDPLPADLDREERQSAYLRASGKDWSAAGYAMSRTQYLSSAPFLSTVGSPLNLYRNRILFADLRYEPTLAGVETLFRIFGDHNQFSDVLEYAHGRDPLTTGLFHEGDPDRSLGAEVQARFRLSEKTLMTLGSEYSRHRYDGSAEESDSLVQTHLNYLLGNSYLQVDWTLSDSLSCVLGLQNSQWSLGKAENITNGQTTPLDRKTLSGLTPRAAFIWLPTAVDIVKVLYGGGYRNPTIFERYYDDGSSYQANSALKPEYITTGQGIWVHVWGGGLQSQFSYSESRWRNLIQQVEVGTSPISQFQNDADSIRGQALEGELKARWPDWELYVQAGVYRWTQAGASLPSVADFQAALRLTRHWGDWSASGEIRHVAGRENLDANTSVPSSTTLRAALRWEQPRFWMRAVVQDATNARPRHLVAADYDPITSMREDGRTFLLTLGLRY